MKCLRKREFLLAAAVVVLLSVLIFLLWCSGLLEQMKDVHTLRDSIAACGAWGALVFAALQIVQLVVSVIPGEPIQIAGGFLYGTWGGFALLFAATVAGSVLSFFLGRKLGYPLVRRLVSRRTMEKFGQHLTKPGAQLLIVLLFLLPGFPKDALIYLGALSPLNGARFLTLTSLARIPTLWGSAYVGSHLYEGDYTAVLVVGLVCAAALLAGLALHRRLSAPGVWEKQEDRHAG